MKSIPFSAIEEESTAWWTDFNGSSDAIAGVVNIILKN
jgi:hypothetical protein